MSSFLFDRKGPFYYNLFLLLKNIFILLIMIIINSTGDLMKRKILKNLNRTADYLEIVISALVIILIIISIGKLIKDLGVFFNNFESEELFKTTLGSIMNIVIGIEFLKMLIKHDIKSVVEVLLFAIARKLLISNTTVMDFLVGILAISIILVVRKFLFVPSLDDVDD